MSLDHAELLRVIIESLLIDDHLLIVFLQQWVQSVKDGSIT